MPKPLPDYQLRFVLHPEEDLEYKHFQDGSSHPFQPRPAGVPRVNAWWLADAALLSYWPQDEARKRFLAAGLDSEFISDGGTDCYLAWQDDAVLVAFRGTQSGQWADILTDAKVSQVSWDVGHVHRGFAEALDAVWSRLTARLDTLSRSRAVWFCGHSLGAALATLAAYRYPATQGVSTIGCPRVGNRAFASAFDNKLRMASLRFVNSQDVVTHVPPPLLLAWIYKHVDVRRFIAKDGMISGGEPPVPHFFSELIGQTEALLETIVGLRDGTLRLAPQFLLDHMPKAYAIWMWNDYETNR